MKVLFDTSAFVALAHPDDRSHREAVEKHERLQSTGARLYTTNAVLYETLNWLAVKAGPSSARELAVRVRTSPAMVVWTLTPEDEAGALAVLQKFRQVPLSFVDASCIHVFRSRALDRVFAFDRHFVQANLPLL